MNIVTSEPSLYQLTQNLDDPLVSVSISPETLKSHVKSIINLVIEKQFSAKVWVKLPQTQSWLEVIRKLYQEGNSEYIYLCSDRQEDLTLLSNLPTSKKTKIVPTKLNCNEYIKRESFIIVVADNFYSLVLSQWQKSQIKIDSSGKRLQQPYLEVVSSFDAPTITKILAGIGRHSQNSSQNNFQIDLETTLEIKLLNDLILKQIHHNETIQTKLGSLSKVERVADQSSTVLGLQEDFLNNLVQELRSPITHMKTALSLLESKQIKGEQRQRYLKMVSDECDRQNSLVGGLLELLQLDTPVEAEYLYLDDIVPGIVSTYQPLAEEREILLGYTIPDDLPPISCPNTWFRQIIINLLNNSLQFTPPQGRVFVQAALKNNHKEIEILVTDTGIGIANKEIDKIFDGFYRTKPTSNQKVKGAGLGLTLVQQLIKRCGGSISVTSKVGKGTTFKILIPAIPAELT